MLMALGPYRFRVATYSVEEISRQVSSRYANQEVIGARPTTHLLGPGEETIRLHSEFFPFHLNGAGLAQLEAVRNACMVQTPLMLISMAGFVFGRWIITDVSDERTIFDVKGKPQKVTVDMDLLRYVPRNGGTMLGLF